MCLFPLLHLVSYFFFPHAATTETYTLSLHDALPISAAESTCPCRRGRRGRPASSGPGSPVPSAPRPPGRARRDRKSTRLNSSHVSISYAVFCLKKKT